MELLKSGMWRVDVCGSDATGLDHFGLPAVEICIKFHPHVNPSPPEIVRIGVK